MERLSQILDGFRKTVGSLDGRERFEPVEQGTSIEERLDRIEAKLDALIMALAEEGEPDEEPITDLEGQTYGVPGREPVAL